MDKDAITERATWENYWKSFSPAEIGLKNQFQSLFEGVKNGDDSLSFIEIGGFPGTFAIYFKKFKSYKVSLLDYFVSLPVIESLLSKNKLDNKDLEVIESDFFTYESPKKYDLVFSSGFIEHFEDTKNVISKHVDLLSDNGTLLVTLPNLKGLNGWFQKTFDKKNYNIHNIDCMDIDLLTDICTKLELKNIEVDFYGKSMVWLETTAPVTKLTLKFVKLFSLSLKLLPFKSQLLSPYIYIKASK
jgi:SAM-dependent methyltransferase